MILTEIKNKIVEQLNKLTIDDFYSDPGIGFAKEIFAKFTSMKTDEEIEKYLTDKFPETSVETLKFSLEKSVINFAEQIVSAEKEISTLQDKIDVLDKNVSDKKGILEDIPKQEYKTKSELSEIETEIKQIEPLVLKPPYNKQIEALENDKQKKNKELESYPIAISEVKKEITELQSQIKTEKEIISQKQKEIKSINSAIENKNKELIQLTEKENTHYFNEYLSLEFLFKILLHKSIEKREVYINRETGEKYSEERHSYSRVVIEKNGEVTIITKKIGFDVYCLFVIDYTNSNAIIPKGWREILYQILSNPIPAISGKISKVNYNSTSYFNRENLELSHVDTSALLAIKIAVIANSSIKTSDNTIILGLSGGLSATIIFSKKGNIIKKFQKQPFEIFANCLDPERFVMQTLYSQNGYADSKIEVKTPGAYYVLTDKFVIEIIFSPAPILFDSNSVIKFAPNISGKAKYRDEIYAEEERERKQKDDDWERMMDDDD